MAKDRSENHAARCPAIPKPLWQELREADAKPPQHPVAANFKLPAGMKAPPAAAGREDRCTKVGSLGALVASLRVCCDDADGWADDGFMEGCRALSACRFEDARGHTARTTNELAGLVAPIDTPAKALGLVALTYPEIVDPSDDKDPAWKGYPGAPPAFEVQPDQDGFIVRAAASGRCGCTHTAYRVAFSVSRAGCVSRLAEKPVALAYAAGECID